MHTGLIGDLQVDALLRALDAGRSDTVLIHASFSALSRKGHRAEALLDALQDYLHAGTLAMPAMSWRSVNLDNPLFDQRTTPAITGILSEMFRARYATHRSLHPTHSLAACGRAAGEITSRHHLDATPCGPSSPWSLLVEQDARVVMLGVGMDTCTLIHCLEEAVEPDKYLRDEVEEYVCRDRHGHEHDVRTRRHRKLVRNFWKFEDMIRAAGRVRYAELDGTPAFAFRARDLMRLGMDHMRSDPLGTLAGPYERSKLM
jgi:aminoglycoside 3-N-acetyltransferase